MGKQYSINTRYNLGAANMAGDVNTKWADLEIKAQSWLVVQLGQQGSDTILKIAIACAIGACISFIL
jgi:hypothetical protein